MAKKIMIQGTMSNSGKSFLAAALCRIFYQDGYRTAPFKSQNMALNSYITDDGLEIGRAQAMQAEAAGISPTAEMNPILLKPTSHMGSQVVIMGEVFGNMKAMDYYRRKPELVPVIKDAFSRLEEQYEVIVLEGAGSPAEINLRENDIVNMGMAEMAPIFVVWSALRQMVIEARSASLSFIALCSDEIQNILGRFVRVVQLDTGCSTEFGLHRQRRLSDVDVADERFLLQLQQYAERVT